MSFFSPRWSGSKSQKRWRIIRDTLFVKYRRLLARCCSYRLNSLRVATLGQLQRLLRRALRTIHVLQVFDVEPHHIARLDELGHHDFQPIFQPG